jgi:flagellar biosynthesis protein FlhF
MKKTEFVGTSMRDAFAKAKQVMGDDALILDSEQLESGIKITVTTPDNAPIIQQKMRTFAVTRDYLNKSRKQILENSDPIGMIKTICDICDRHHLGEAFCESWLKCVSKDMNRNDVILDDSIESVLKFSPKWIYDVSPDSPIILVGPQGAGKTSMVAKLAILLSSIKKNYRVVTLDDIKAGGSDQLAVYMKALKQPLGIGYDAYIKIKSEAIKNDYILIIDTPGVNILDKDGMGYFYKLSERIRDPLTLVMPADLDTDTASEIAKEFTTYNISQILATKLDSARTFGAILRPAFEQELTLTVYSDSSRIIDSIHPLTSENVVKILND